MPSPWIAGYMGDPPSAAAASGSLQSLAGGAGAASSWWQNLHSKDLQSLLFAERRMLPFVVTCWFTNQILSCFGDSKNPKQKSPAVAPPSWSTEKKVGGVSVPLQVPLLLPSHGSACSPWAAIGMGISSGSALAAKSLCLPTWEWPGIDLFWATARTGCLPQLKTVTVFLYRYNSY